VLLRVDGNRTRGRSGRYDLALTERIDGDGRRYVVDVGTDNGAAVLAELPHREADQSEIDSARSDVSEASS
jgi:hypothetical protein